MIGVFMRIGFLSFGGPAGQIALMHRELVEERRWVEEEQYLHALNFCHLLPGPGAQQLATWIGWKLHGLRDGLAAGLLFVLPGAFIILALTILYAFAAKLDWFAALFLGIKAAVLAIVVQALIRIAGRALNTTFKKALAVAAFIALFLFAAPFPLVVLGAGAIGMAVAAVRPDWLAIRLPGPERPSPPPADAPRPRPTIGQGHGPTRRQAAAISSRRRPDTVPPRPGRKPGKRRAFPWDRTHERANPAGCYRHQMPGLPIRPDGKGNMERANRGLRLLELPAPPVPARPPL